MDTESTVQTLCMRQADTNGDVTSIDRYIAGVFNRGQLLLPLALLALLFLALFSALLDVLGIDTRLFRRGKQCLLLVRERVLLFRTRVLYPILD